MNFFMKMKIISTWSEINLYNLQQVKQIANSEDVAKVNDIFNCEFVGYLAWRHPTTISLMVRSFDLAYQSYQTHFKGSPPNPRMYDCIILSIVWWQSPFRRQQNMISFTKETHLYYLYSKLFILYVYVFHTCSEIMLHTFILIKIMKLNHIE